MSEEYLTPEELGRMIKFSKQSIYNLIHKKTFLLGVHYFKPTRKKILFKISAIKKWIEGPGGIQDENERPSVAFSAGPDTQPKGRINI
jgi:hypothetical protein